MFSFRHTGPGTEGAVNCSGRKLGVGTLCLAVFILAFAVRLAIALSSGRLYDLCLMETERVAVTLAREGRYADPFMVPTGPTAHVAPAYTLILALIFKLFGTGALGAAVKQIVTCAVAALRVSLVPLLAFQAGLGMRVALMTAALGVVWIFAPLVEVEGNFSAPWEALLLLLLIRAVYKRPVLTLRLRETFLFGAAWGLLALFNPVALIVLAALAVLWGWEQRHALPALAARVAVIAAAAALVMAPWAYRNHSAMGKWIWTRGNLGIEIGNGFFPGAYYDMVRNIQSPGMGHLLSSRTEAEAVRRMGETAYNEYRLKKAMAYLRTHPAESLNLVLQRFFRFWFPAGRNILQGAVCGVFMLLAFAGIPLLWRSNRRLAHLLITVLVFFPLIYYIVHWTARYRVPIEWILVLLASLTLARASEKIWPVQKRSAGDERRPSQ